jgi:dTDP-4-dehydrorhamnose 3,5-epimerase
MESPILYKGAVAVDDRGAVSFVNDFAFAGVKRFYTVENHRRGFVRAWHAHKRESKYVMVVHGSAIIGAVAIDDWDKPSTDQQIHRYILSDRTPSVLYIPSGYANGFKTLTEGAKILFFSTSSLDESKGDDFRYDARYWNAWEEVER